MLLSGGDDKRASQEAKRRRGAACRKSKVDVGGVARKDESKGREDEQSARTECGADGLQKGRAREN